MGVRLRVVLSVGMCLRVVVSVVVSVGWRASVGVRASARAGTRSVDLRLRLELSSTAWVGATHVHLGDVYLGRGDRAGKGIAASA